MQSLCNLRFCYVTMSREMRDTDKYTYLTKQVVLSILLLCFLFLLTASVPIGWDFHIVFFPAGQALLRGESPYTVEGFYNPPWLAIFFLPFAMLPEEIAWRLFLSFSLALYFHALIKLQSKFLSLFLVLTSSYVFISLLYGNIDSLVLLGMTLPPQIGIWFLLLKPQMSLGLICLWGVRAISKGWKESLMIFGLPAAVYLICWFLGIHPQDSPIQQAWNIHVWPFGLAIGIPILWLALKHQNINLAMSASPFLSPYVAPQSWIVSLLPVMQKKFTLVFGVFVSWFLMILRFVIHEKALMYEPFILMGWGLILFITNMKNRKTLESTNPEV